MFTTEKEIKAWLKQVKIKSYKIQKDLSIEVRDCVDLSMLLTGPRAATNLKRLPVKFDVIHGFFDISNNHLETLEGCPNLVKGDFSCTNNSLTSLDGAPSVVEGDVTIYGNNKITNLHDIHKIFKEISGIGDAGGSIGLDEKNIKGSILGLLMIKGLGMIDSHLPSWHKSNEGNPMHEKPFQILYSFIPNEHGKQSVFDCQDQLIEAGFDDYAKL